MDTRLCAWPVFIMCVDVDVVVSTHRQEEGEELDSWMFQTVTTNVVIALSECLGYPMYRMKFPKDMKILNKDLEYFDISKEINEVFSASEFL
jgi:diphthamide synthase (EF-2-diphthine--ammonia ligase)